MNGRESSQRGSVLVETTLVLTMLLSLLLGIMSFGQMLFVYNTVCNAAREGSRYAMVNGQDSGHPISSAAVTTYVEKYGPGLNPANLTVTTNWCVSHNTTCSTTRSSTNSSAGNVVKVTVQYTFKSVFSIIKIPDVTFTSVSEMAISQ